MSWFYPVKVNTALAAMAVPPTHFSSEWRSGMQQIGKAAGLTPQEAALVIVAHGLGLQRPDDVEVAMMVWAKERKISYSKPEVKDALDRLGYAVDFD